MTKPVVIVGGGPAGLIAAESAKLNGAERVIVIDRERHTGGILNQCIHAGFGLGLFKEELTGPEFADRVSKAALKAGVEFLTETTVLSINDQRQITITSEKGVDTIDAGAIVMCTGCRERPRGVIHIPGERPAGIYTAGLAQKLVNTSGYLIGKKVVILGSGDIGLIMARRMTLQGAKVLAVVEVMKNPGGLQRNIIQCLDDFGIPLYLSHTIINIKGKKRVEQVTIAKLDDKMQPIAGTEFTLDCDTVLLSVGLIPENEVAKTVGIKLNERSNGMIVDENLMTSVDGIFGCGNALHVHDLVDNLAVEAKEAGKNAADYVNGTQFEKSTIDVKFDGGFGYVLPYKVSGTKAVRLQFRVRAPHKNATITCNGFTKRYPHLQPNHMESITVPAENLTSEVCLCLND